MDVPQFAAEEQARAQADIEAYTQRRMADARTPAEQTQARADIEAYTRRRLSEAQYRIQAAQMSPESNGPEGSMKGIPFGGGALANAGSGPVTSGTLAPGSFAPSGGSPFGGGGFLGGGRGLPTGANPGRVSPLVQLGQVAAIFALPPPYNIAAAAALGLLGNLDFTALSPTPGHGLPGFMGQGITGIAPPEPDLFGGYGRGDAPGQEAGRDPGPGEGHENY